MVLTRQRRRLMEQENINPSLDRKRRKLNDDDTDNISWLASDEEEENWSESEENWSKSEGEGEGEGEGDSDSDKDELNLCKSDSDKDELNLCKSDGDKMIETSKRFTQRKSPRKKSKVKYKESESDSEDDVDGMLTKLKKNDKETYKIFLKIKKELERRLPNIVNILKTPMRLKDKSTLVELYEIFSMTPPMTEEWVELKYRINNLLKVYKESYKDYSNFTEMDIERSKVLSKELKEIASHFSLKYQILNLNTSKENKAVLYKKYREFKHLELKDDEYGKLKTWLKWGINLPHNNVKTIDYTNFNLTEFMRNISKKLDEKLYGMHDVKQQILIFLNSKITNPNMVGCSLGLVGPPGVGKTTIARLLAEVLDWPFEQISFGGVSNQEFLKGHDYTYVGSRPGEIARCLNRMKYKNGILFFDEYEKISNNKDIVSLLLHVTDSQQNSEFRDNYLSDLTIDLSKMWFIYSMNNPPEDTALKDRIFLINVAGYKLDDKIRILCDYVLPKTLLNIGKKKEEIIITDDIAKIIINKTNKEEGIRSLENIIKDLINKINFLVNHQNDKGKLIGFSNINFKYEKKLTYPITLTEELIENLCKEKKDEQVHLSMYI